MRNIALWAAGAFVATIFGCQACGTGTLDGAPSQEASVPWSSEDASAYLAIEAQLVRQHKELRVGVDTFQRLPASTRVVPYNQREVTDYGQYYRGVRVASGACTVSRVSATREIHDVICVFRDQIGNPSITPKVAEAEAWAIASPRIHRDGVANDPRVEGKKVIVWAEKPPERRWTLGWEYQAGRRVITVSAQTGEVIAFVDSSIMY